MSGSMKFDLKPLEDFSMLMTALHSIDYNLDSLKELVHEWVTMATQKDAGLRKDSKGIPFDNVERVKMGILCEAIALVLSGDLDTLEQIQKARLKGVKKPRLKGSKKR